MDKTSANRIVQTLPADALVVDVGGGASPFARADYVIDALPFQERAKLGVHDLAIQPRYSEARWVQTDLCSHERWPFADGFFDYATCSHLLEDVRDPVWICAELSRVAKAGYIEIPSRIVEQSLGVEHPRYAGYHHHRWLVSVADGAIEFRHKPHCLHTTRDAIVAKVGIRRSINPKHSITTLEWTGKIDCREVLEFSEEAVVEELCQFAREARRLPDLTVSNALSWTQQAKRGVYFTRLSMGRR